MFKGIKRIIGVLLLMASLLVPSVAFAEEAPTLTIVGDPLVGETLEAVFTGADGTEAYQWYRYNNRMWESLEGGNTSKYKFTSNMGGNRIQCKVTHNGSTYYAYVDRINIRELSVKITGTPNVGEVLVAEVEPADATVLYQWYRKDEYSPISGATGSSYLLTEEDKKKQIGVTVTGIENYVGAKAGVRGSTIGEPLGTDIVTPWHEDSLYGKSVYTADILYAVADGLDVATYEWQRSCNVNGSSWWSTEGTESTYVVPERTGNGGWENSGNGETSTIRLVITEVDGTKHYSYQLHCLDETNPDSGETGGTEEENITVAIEGEPLMGKTLTTMVTGGNGTETYQWYRYTVDGVVAYEDKINEETSSTYTVGGNIKIGDKIWCVVSYAGKTYTTDKVIIQDTEEGGDNSGETGGNGSGDNSGETGGKIEDSLSGVEYATASEATQKDVLVVASQGSSFTVTIPKRITLDGSTGTADYEVTVQGDITGEEVIIVTPSKTFEMVSAGKKAIKASVTQVKEAFSVALDTMEGLLEGVVTTGKVEVENLTAGEWEGICTFTIKITN